jgi:hypothetical protein
VGQSWSIVSVRNKVLYPCSSERVEVAEYLDTLNFASSTQPRRTHSPVWPKPMRYGTLRLLSTRQSRDAH